MHTHVTIHQPHAPVLRYHPNLAHYGNDDDFVTLSIGTALTDSVTLHFTNAGFTDWLNELMRNAPALRRQIDEQTTRRDRRASMTSAQIAALSNLCDRYKVEFDPMHYATQFDLPSGYVGGWIGGPNHSSLDPMIDKPTLYVGCSPEGDISS